MITRRRLQEPANQRGVVTKAIDQVAVVDWIAWCKLAHSPLPADVPAEIERLKPVVEMLAGMERAGETPKADLCP